MAFFVLAPLFGVGQKLIDRAATAHFFSSTPVEDIEALNEKALGALDLAKGEVAVSMNMTDFNFKKSLMQEHFNENYLESDKYPKATFTGLIEGFDAKRVLEARDTLTFEAAGQMTIHGVTNDFAGPVSFVKSGDQLKAMTKFMISIADYDIDIPKIVIMNIAEEVEVTAKFSFEITDK